jgi:ribose-phosphate pyrophosphokinase
MSLNSGTIRLFSGNSNLPLAAQMCDYIGVKLRTVDVSNFPDGETAVIIRESIRGGDIFIVQSCDHPANFNYMELLIKINAARRAAAGRIAVILPFFGYASQDRKDRPRVPVTAKSIANLFASRNVL